jgi:hypothetical protein
VPFAPDFALWPSQLRDLAGSLGAGLVWQTAIDVLGYPLTLGMTGKQLVSVITALKSLPSVVQQAGQKGSADHGT